MILLKWLYTKEMILYNITVIGIQIHMNVRGINVNVERLNDNQIRFVFHAQELAARDISMTDILTRSTPKTQGLFQEITTMLQNEYDFSVAGTPLVFEAAVSQDGLSVLVTKMTGQEGMAPGAVGGFAGFPGVQGMINNVISQVSKGGYPPGGSNHPHGMPMPHGSNIHQPHLGNVPPPPPPESGYAVYSFESLDLLAAATARIWSAYCGRSHIYKMDEKYFLILQDKGNGVKSTKRFDMLLSELGQREVSSPLSYSHMVECGEAIIAEDAVSKMKAYYGGSI